MADPGISRLGPWPKICDSIMTILATVFANKVDRRNELKVVYADDGATKQCMILRISDVGRVFEVVPRLFLRMLFDTQ